MNREKMDIWIRKRREENYKKTGFRMWDIVEFLDFSTNPPTTRTGRIEVVDENGGGEYCGVSPSFDIMSEDVLYKHVPVKNIVKVTGTDLTPGPWSGLNSSESD